MRKSADGDEFGIILLAAGSSSRMGQSKQLLPILGETLLVRTIKTALAAETRRVVVVLGANEHEHRAVITHLPVEVICNPHWEKGMGSSLKCGLSFLLEKIPSLDGVIILVCDQPFLSASHIQKLILTYRQTGKPISASEYSKTKGVPALFDRSAFPQLLDLEDGQGAKQIINEKPEQVSLVDFPLGEIDLDTPEDYNVLKNKGA